MAQITGKSYKERYLEIVKADDNFFDSILTDIVMMFKTIWLKPIRIGNYWYFYVNHNGVDVPAYCHQQDYNEDLPKFLPIYDKSGNNEFGWTDKMEVVRILDMLRNRFYEEKGI